MESAYKKRFESADYIPIETQKDEVSGDTQLHIFAPPAALCLFPKENNANVGVDDQLPDTHSFNVGVNWYYPIEYLKNIHTLTTMYLKRKKSNNHKG